MNTNVTVEGETTILTQTHGNMQITQILSTPTEISLRVGGVYVDAAGNEVTIDSFSLNRDRAFYYGATNGEFYRMNGTHVDTDLVDVVDVSNVPSVEPIVGKTFRTERNDKVDIGRKTDDVEGYPYRSMVGDYYNEKGERFCASPGSHLVMVAD